MTIQIVNVILEYIKMIIKLGMRKLICFLQLGLIALRKCVPFSNTAQFWVIEGGLGVEICNG